MISWDTTQHVARLNLYDKRHLDASRKGLQQVTNDLWKESMNLVPVREGTLLRSATMRVMVKPGLAEGAVFYNTPYAAKVHEDMTPAPGATMRPGPDTQMKNATAWGIPGGHYLAQPLKSKMTVWMRSIAKRIKGIR